MRNSLQLALLPLVLAFSLLAGLTACSEGGTDRAGLVTPALRVDSVVERKAGIRDLQAAWRQRPRETSDGNRRAEKRFINTLGSFLSRLRGTAEFTPACGVWNECVREHTAQYGEIDR